MLHWSRPNSILLIFTLGWSFRIYIPIISLLTHVIKLFFFCILFPQFFIWVQIALFLISPSELFWISALLLVEKSIIFNCATVYLTLCTKFSWFCSFHFASILGGHSSSPGISPAHYSFEHNSIPSPTDTTICLAIPQLKDIPSFSNSLPPQRVRL